MKEKCRLIRLKNSYFALSILLCLPLIALKPNISLGQEKNLDALFINALEASEISKRLSRGLKEYAFPESLEDKDVIINSTIIWSTASDLIIQTKRNIVIKPEAKIISSGEGAILLKAGMEPDDNNFEKQSQSLKNKRIYDSRIDFEGSQPQIFLLGGGVAKIYYNPIREKGDKHKYFNPTIYSFFIHPSKNYEPYMLINNVYDLKDMAVSLFSNFALSQNIDASRTKRWNDKDGEGKGFPPIKGFKDKVPFSGIFDGNNYKIQKLYIRRPNEDNIGLFGDVTGVNRYQSEIKNINLEDSDIEGKRCVGALVGQATGVKITNVTLLSTHVKSHDEENGIESNIKGLLGGCIFSNTYKDIFAYDEDGKEIIESSLFGSCILCNNEDSDSNGGIKEDYKEKIHKTKIAHEDSEL